MALMPAKLLKDFILVEKLPILSYLLYLKIGLAI